MFRRKGENLHAIFILLFLNIAFFLLEQQDAARYAALFRFDRAAVLRGELWRLVTYQFTQAGQGWFFFPRPLVLFFNLLLLYLMGSALEEEWGTRPFLTFFAISTLGTAAAGWFLGVPLLGSYFVNFSLLFVFASVVSDDAFKLFGIIPIRWLAYFAATVLTFGALFGSTTNIAAIAGAAAGYVYFLMSRQRVTKAAAKRENRLSSADAAAIRNAARFVAMRKAVSNRSRADLDRLIAQAEREIVNGVNICAPADFKPETMDGYCIRCEGFAECSARFLRAHHPGPEPHADAAALPEATTP
jgi:membrane associated rhomboid family serine protease